MKPLAPPLAEPAYTIETDLTEEEIAWIEEGDREFKEHPENFVPFDSIKW